MKKEFFRSAIICVVLCAVMVAGVRPALAAKVATRYAADFGTLRGELFDAYAESSGEYYFTYETRVTNMLYRTGTLKTTVEIQNAITGVPIDEVVVSDMGVDTSGGCYDLDRITGYKNKTYKVYGTHETIPPTSVTASQTYVVYTSTTYNYYNDLE